MRISDWSSDVCSSDLGNEALAGFRQRRLDHRMPAAGDVETGGVGKVGATPVVAHRMVGERGGDVDSRENVAARGDRLARSEEHTAELQSLMRISHVGIRFNKQKNYPQQQLH